MSIGYTPRILFLVLLFSFLSPLPLWAAPNLTIGSASGMAGATVSIPVTFDPTTDSVAGIQFTLTLPASVSTVSVTAGAIVTNAGKSVSTNRVGNNWTFIVFGLNQTTIAAGSLLTAQVSIAPATAAGTLSVPVSGVTYADPNGQTIAPGTSTSGSITVLPPPNQRPVANAGVDRTITLPSTTTLAGTATDDGLPNPPGQLTTTWSRVSGPGTVTFGNASALNTIASFSTSGTYVLRLTASDSVLSSTDDVTVIVNPAPVINQRPVVNAGVDRTITLPSTATLAGTATDDGLPNPPGAMTYSWTRLSGPGTVTFGSASSLTTSVSFTQAGTHVFRLTASDSVLSSTDDVTVIVNPAPVVNQAPVVNAGADQTVTLPSSVIVSGTAFDDGQPNPPNAMTFTWSRLSGPGTVTFTNFNFLTTTATFSQAGTYVIQLAAYDGALTSTDTVTITVNPAPAVNQRPVVNAGADRAITLPSTTTLAGTASDDGLPNPPGAMTFSWTRVSGPGTVTFGNASALNTIASFSTSGTYVLRLSASDSVLSSTDDVTVIVNPAPVVTPPTLAAGTGSGIAGSTVSVSVTFNTGSTAVAGMQFDLMLPAGVSTESVTAGSIVTSAGKSVSSNRIGQRWTFIVFGLNQNTIASGSLLTAQMRLGATMAAGTYALPITSVTFTDANGQAIASGANTGGSIIVSAPANQRPSVNAGADQTITLPSTATLTGIALDDGLPNPPGQLTTAWSRVSGPGTVTFGSASSLTTSVSFTQAGTHVFRLTASDSVLSSTDDVTVIVNPRPNLPPSVNAGADQSITIGSTVTLVGTASDDGQPNPPGILTTAWSQASGPGTAVFGNAASLTTTATFSIPGTYVLRLTASDSVLSSTDSVTITVSSNTAPQNQPPAVNAGIDQTVTLAAGATLVGAGADDGQPNPPGVITALWSRLSGPGAVNFAAPNAFVTGASFSSTGTYLLRLTVSDSVLASSDTVTVTVVPNPVPTNLPPVTNAGPDQIIQLPAQANLSGAAADDGLPNPPAQLTYAWSLLSGPGTVSFGSPNALATTAAFTQPGTYQIQLAASDSALSSTDVMTVLVNAPQAPQAILSAAPSVINAGESAILSWMALNGTVISIDQGIGPVSAAGSLAVSPAVTTTYTLTVTGPGGTATAQTTIVVQTSGGSALPTPSINTWPSVLPVDGSLTVGYPSGYPNVGFVWSINIATGSAAAPAGRVSGVAGALNANFQTMSYVAPLGAYNLEPGYYSVTVYAVDSQGNVSQPAQAFLTLVSANFTSVRAFPNPWRSDRHSSRQITFDGLPLESTVKIFTASGHWVKTLLLSTPSSAVWDLTNDAGDPVASGIYMYLITAAGSDGNARGKIAIIK